MEGPALAGSSAAAPIAGGRTWHVAALPLRGAPLGDGRSGVFGVLHSRLAQCSSGRALVIGIGSSQLSKGRAAFPQQRSAIKQQTQVFPSTNGTRRVCFA
jgi:hypothetical protein